MNISLDSILTQLPEEMQLLLESEEEQNWFTILDEQDSKGESLVYLFLSMVKNNVDPDLVQELSTIIANKQTLGNLSDGAIKIYDQANKILQPSKKIAPLLSKKIVEFTNLTIELSTIVTEYLLPPVFPWRNIIFVYYAGGKNDCLLGVDGCRAYHASLNSRNTKKMYFLDIIINNSSITENLDKILKKELIIKFSDNNNKSMSNLFSYFRTYFIPNPEKYILNDITDTITLIAKEQNEAQVLISILEDITDFPKDILEDIKKHVDKLFD